MLKKIVLAAAIAIASLVSFNLGVAQADPPVCDAGGCG
jgi:hypothetical protein